MAEVTIGNSVTTIGDSAFENCTGLAEVTIGNSVTTIGSYAFAYCAGLTELTIPNSVTEIGYFAFAYCTGLTEVTIGNSVTTIGSAAFYDSNAIQTIYCKPTIPPTYNSHFSDYILMYTTLYVPMGTKSVYESVDPWRNFWNIEEIDYAGIDDVAVDSSEVEISYTGDGLIISGADGATVEIFAINGLLVGRIDSYDGAAIALNTGAYIVRVGDNVQKALVR